jgi:hypothetical protein
MFMTPTFRKFALTAHVTSSVGWLGAVAGFLALAVAGITSQNGQLVRASYLAMHLITWFVIVPFCLASLTTGVAQALATPWGLFRHYWIVTKLLLTIVATIILLVHTQPIDRVAAVAAESGLSSGSLRELRVQLVGDAAAALFVLLMTTALSVYKPWGLTSYGARLQYESAAPRPSANRRPENAGRYVLLAIVGVVAVILVLHLFGIGLHGH